MKIRVSHLWGFVALFSVVLLVICAQPIYHAWVYHRAVELYKTAPTIGSTSTKVYTNLFDIEMELWRLHTPLLKTGYVVPYRMEVAGNWQTCFSTIVDLNREGKVRVARLRVQGLDPPTPDSPSMADITVVATPRDLKIIHEALGQSFEILNSVEITPEEAFLN